LRQLLWANIPRLNRRLEGVDLYVLFTLGIDA